MVSVKEFDDMMDCWARANNNTAKLNEIERAINIAERLIYNKEYCEKQLDGIQQRTILVLLEEAKKRLLK